MAMDANRSQLEEIRHRIGQLRDEIADLIKTHQEQRLEPQTHVQGEAPSKHDARIARINEIKEELAKLGGSKK